MKRQNKKHLNPAEQRELTDADFFGGWYSVDMWDSINKLAKSSPDAHDAIYTLGCRLQEFESFVRRRLNELKFVQLRFRLADVLKEDAEFKEALKKSRTFMSKLKEWIDQRNMPDEKIMRLVFGFTDEEIKSLRKGL